VGWAPLGEMRAREARRSGAWPQPCPNPFLHNHKLHDYANICSMTSQGHPCARFRRALATGNPQIAEAAAREVRRLSLPDALDLCLLYRGEPAKYERAAARWVARLIAQRPGLHLSQIQLAAAGFREAQHHPRGEAALRELLDVVTSSSEG
jgi:hypothetical protein